MKKRILSIVLTLVMLLSVSPLGAFNLTASAASENGFTYSVSNNQATITDYTGLATDLDIPDALGGYSVTSISGWAFVRCTALESIEIPDSVTTIGEYAFSFCTALESIEIPDSVTTIGEYAFEGCTALESITIPDSVIHIGESAFSYCTALESIEIPDSVTEIGQYAFYNCTALTSISVSANNNYFSSVNGVLFNKDLTTLICYPAGKGDSYTIPDSVTVIDSWTFYNCTALTSVTIPDSVIYIGAWAFSGCTALESVTIGNSVTGIGAEAFKYCFALKSIEIPDSVTRISWQAFSGCTALESIEIPDSVTTIGEYAFEGCAALQSVTIGDSVTEIGLGAFTNCDALESITIPDSVTTIGEYAFGGCAALTSVTIPDSVTTIGEYAFGGCAALESITIPDSVTGIGWYAFSDTHYYNNSANWQNGVLYIGNHLINAETNITTCIIKQGTKTIADYAFEGCTALESVTIGNSVTEIGFEAFYECTALTDVYYSGTEAEWNDIINVDNYLLNANIHFNYSMHTITFKDAQGVLATFSVEAGDFIDADKVEEIEANIRSAYGYTVMKYEDGSVVWNNPVDQPVVEDLIIEVRYKRDSSLTTAVTVTKVDGTKPYNNVKIPYDAAITVEDVKANSWKMGDAVVATGTTLKLYACGDKMDIVAKAEVLPVDELSIMGKINDGTNFIVFAHANPAKTIKKYGFIFGSSTYMKDYYGKEGRDFTLDDTDAFVKTSSHNKLLQNIEKEVDNVAAVDFMAPLKLSKPTAVRYARAYVMYTDGTFTYSSIICNQSTEENTGEFGYAQLDKVTEEMEE